MKRFGRTTAIVGNAIRALRSGLTVVFVATCFANALLAQQPGAGRSEQENQPPKTKPPQKSKLDQQLLDDLDNDLLKGLDDLPPATKKADPADGQQPPADTAPAQQPMEESANPLAKIGQRMRRAEQLLAGQDTSEKTQQLQQEIITQLAQLLEAARPQQSNNNRNSTGGSSGEQDATGDAAAGNEPARESTNRIGNAPSEEVKAEEMKAALAEFWGHLPEQVRQQMLSSASLQFLPKYQELIEQYYKRLAETRDDPP